MTVNTGWTANQSSSIDCGDSHYRTSHLDSRSRYNNGTAAHSTGCIQQLLHSFVWRFGEQNKIVVYVALCEVNLLLIFIEQIFLKKLAYAD